MRNRWSVSLAACLALTILVRADDQADARKVVERAIKASGGGKNLTKFRATTVKFKGKFYQNDSGVAYTGEIVAQYPGQQKLTINFEMGGMAVTFTRVVNKDKGWTKINTMEATALGKAELAEEKEQMYARSLGTLLPLREKGVQLSPVGEVQVGKHNAVGVKVSRKGHRDVNLYFDKKTGLLLKSETIVKAMETGSEVSFEAFYDNYKEVEGIKRPSKMQMKMDGKKYVDIDETTDVTVHDKLDDSEFAKP
jgi:hypothetical protein